MPLIGYIADLQIPVGQVVYKMQQGQRLGTGFFVNYTRYRSESGNDKSYSIDDDFSVCIGPNINMCLKKLRKYREPFEKH